MNSLFRLPENLLREAVCFLLVGVVSASVYSGTIVLFVEAGLLDPVPATAVGFVIGTLASYVGNARFSFRRDPTLESWVKFVVVTGIGFGLNVGLMRLSVDTGLHYGLGIALVLISVPVFNFAGHKLWTFREGKPRSGARRA